MTSTKLTTVTERERDAYLHFITDELVPHLPREKLPDVLWHYTGGTGLLGIIQERSIWATQVSCLNDSTEVEYGFDLMRNSLLACGTRPTFRRAERQLLIAVEKDWANVSRITSDWFVACFTTHGDDLSQWRAYGGGEGGFAIGFRTGGLMKAFPASPILLPVSYRREAHETLAQRIAEGTLAFFREGLKARPDHAPQQWVNMFLPAWTAAIAYVLPMMKHSAFEAESEWRLIYKPAPKDYQRMKFRAMPSMLSRHMPLTFETGDRKSFVISEIKIGPARHMEISRASVRDLLRAHGYPNATTVSSSNIPFQAA
jgi:hypothetical protein